jgi:hypothetical protein
MTFHAMRKKSDMTGNANRIRNIYRCLFRIRLVVENIQ